MLFTKITQIPIGPINVQAWGLLVGLGMLVGLFIALAEAKRKGLNKESIRCFFNFRDIFDDWWQDYVHCALLGKF